MLIQEASSGSITQVSHERLDEPKGKRRLLKLPPEHQDVILNRALSNTAQSHTYLTTAYDVKDSPEQRDTRTAVLTI